jgi:hypothetical protein
MVKKFLLPSAFLLGVLSLAVLGCNQSNAPVIPRSQASLVLSYPVPKATPSAKSKAIHPSAVTLSGGIFEYRISSGSEAVTGSVDLGSSTASLGTVTIPLPHGGKWLVSAEWFYTYSVGNVSPQNITNGDPAFIGADEADVEGTTPFTLQMGDAGYSCYCYYSDLSDINSYYYSAYGYFSLFTFDSNLTAPVSDGGGDIECLEDAGSQSDYFAAANGSTATFAYLGTGDWVDYTGIPAGTKFYADSLAAKQAVKGAGSIMEDYDVYAVKLSSGAVAWVQVFYTAADPLYRYVEIIFRVNNQGLSYMKFDQTSCGLSNCDPIE